MTSYTADGQFDFDSVIGERDKRLGIDSKAKAEKRKDIPEPQVHADADWVCIHLDEYFENPRHSADLFSKAWKN